MNPRLRSGVMLLVAAVALVLLLDPRGPLPFYWLPLGAGLGFLAAAAASGRPGRMWEAGFVLTGWGIAAALVLSGTVDAPSTPAYTVGVLVGAAVAWAARNWGLRVTVAGLVLAAVYVVLSLLWAEYGPRGLRTDAAVFAALLALRGLIELAAAARSRSRVGENDVG